MTEIRPDYYKSGGLEAFDVIDAFDLDFNLGNAFKYIARAGKKDINDWLLWLMVLKIFMDKHDWKSLLFCLVVAVALYVANRVIDEKMEDKRC
ncbi:DUF3310 domain-containing protein [Anaerococcus sp. NML200574]|uniref:DUF3310 domain-containing protein n=1 Tax=Anaerococcus sp. NML200574 TaxID=2954486 RepID=UPI0022371129|nr:DUF3310 domain-containing protein [Anaerococcus sp. NML200574]MCW6678181.1 DUF3310 domain-containing protein [Anaerococcus sp. NML200574]